MLHDRFTEIYYPEYKPRPPCAEDYVLMFQDRDVLLENKNGGLRMPRYELMATHVADIDDKLIYLFAVGDHAFYLLKSNLPPKTKCLRFEPAKNFRTFEPANLAFAGATGGHLYSWYRTHVFCGACGKRFIHSKSERALSCAGCGHVVYPQIAPVVIVGITNGDKILATKYAEGSYKKYALVGGFVEIGEDFEDAVRREVMEEVGLKVKNIRYYKSQPWAFTGGLLAGFFADVDGDSAITMDCCELAEARWAQRNEIPTNPDFDFNSISLTSEMIRAFYSGNFPC